MRACRDIGYKGWSAGPIKAVLPARTGYSYAGLAIQEGDNASREFLRVTYGDVEEGERQKVRLSLTWDGASIDWLKTNPTSNRRSIP